MTGPDARAVRAPTAARPPSRPGQEAIAVRRERAGEQQRAGAERQTGERRGERIARRDARPAVDRRRRGQAAAARRRSATSATTTAKSHQLGRQEVEAAPARSRRPARCAEASAPASSTGRKGRTRRRARGRRRDRCRRRCRSCRWAVPGCATVRGCAGRTIDDALQRRRRHSDGSRGDRWSSRRAIGGPGGRGPAHRARAGALRGAVRGPHARA